MNSSLAPEKDIVITHYVNARAKEMEAMACHVAKAVGNKNVRQVVPMHMRRRAASHKIKRLPRNLRKIAAKTLVQKSLKVPSRKHRRRPKNLLAEYNRRKRSKVWLETHIWHAKRCHMTEGWGYKLANHVNDKGVRAAYRASGKYCQLWDMSYLNCIELTGPVEALLNGLSRLTSPKIGQAFDSRSVLGGSIEGQTYLYECDTFPKSAIGPVSFMWKHGKQLIDTRVLWIWCHPAIHIQLINEFTELWGMSCLESNNDESHVKNFGMYRKYPKVINPKYASADGEVKITLLKDNLCRFKLRGPASVAILQNLLKPTDFIPTDKEENMEVDIADEGTEDAETTNNNTPAKYWWRDFDAYATQPDVHKQQCALWETLLSKPSWDHLPPGTVFGLIVRDPRLFLPKKKSLVFNSESEPNKNNFQKEESGFAWPHLACSPLWDEAVRENIKDTMLTDAEINQERSKLTVPGHLVDLGDKESRVPVMLIHRPQSCASTSENGRSLKRLPDNYGGGWDLLAPPGWGMAFLVALIYRGARVGGLTELGRSDFEIGGKQLQWSPFTPDTPAGKTQEVKDRANLEAAYKKRPPAKRVNYTKLGFLEPFYCPWKRLTVDWGRMIGIHSVTTSETAPVIRDVEQLQWLKLFLETGENNERLSDSKHYLVPVKLCVVLRGSCDSRSAICTPNKDDMERFRLDKNCAGPIEEIHSELVTQKDTVQDTTESTEASKSEVTSLVTHCSRETIGYVSQGGFSFRLGQGVGYGYIALASLFSSSVNYSRYDGQFIVLVRPVNGNQYRFASLHILQ